jgi:uncharacterized protein (TIGR03437 family)
MCWPSTAAVARLSPDGARLDYASYIPQHCVGATPPIQFPGPAAGPSLDGVANAFSGDPTAVALGGLYALTVSGVSLPSIDLTLTPKDPLPKTLGGVEVRFDGVLAEIVQSAPGRILVVAPQRTSPRILDDRTVAVQVFVNSAASNVVRMPLWDSAPGFLTHDFLNPAADAGVSIAYALNSDGTINRADNPAAAGSTITLFATGLGAPAAPLYASWKSGMVEAERSPEIVEAVPGFIPAISQVRLTLPPTLYGTDLPNGVRQVHLGVRFAPTPYSSTPYASNGVSVFVK